MVNNVLPVLGLALFAVVVLVRLKEERAAIGRALSIAIGVTVFLFALGMVGDIITRLGDLASKGGINSFYLTTILRIVGIAYITEFAGQVCRDANEGAVASTVDLAGKIALLTMTVPIVISVLNAILGLLP